MQKKRRAPPRLVLERFGTALLHRVYSDINFFELIRQFPEVGVSADIDHVSGKRPLFRLVRQCRAN